MTQTFEELMVEIQNGTPMAFEELYNEAKPKVISTLLLIGACPEDIDDLVQETMFRVWERCQQFSPEQGKVMPWINRIARNQWVDLCRRRGRQRHGGGESFADFPLDELEDKGDTRNPAVYRALKAEIKRLPREMKVVCNGTLKGESLRQIAKRRGYHGAKASRIMIKARERLATSRTLRELADA